MVTLITHFLASKMNLHRSKWRTTCCETPYKISPKSDG